MILITGATGFIGAYTARAVRGRGHEVVAVSRYEWRDEARFILGGDLPDLARIDTGDPAALETLVRERRPDTIIHLDAYVNPVGLRDDPVRAVEANVEPTLALLELCRRYGVGRFVLASTVAVLPSIRYEPIDAAHPLVTPREGPAGGFYGVSKAVSEMLALGYADAFPLDVRIVRPSAVYGFGMQWPIGVKPVVEGICDGREVDISTSGPPRDFTPVHDVAAIFAAAAECAADSDRVFFAGTGRPLITPTEYLDIVRATFPRARVRAVDENADPAGVESRYRGVVDMTPVREQLGVEPAFATLGDGLAHYAEAYRRFRDTR
ncbi:MAG: NAD(P)-dependent oxidoreductase [Microbacterium sp.]|jgi:nucleoside-diphosphate-sugar epimerase|nr:NAD(P)-dependent oxidoreductase [Microbacterium sp.]